MGQLVPLLGIFPVLPSDEYHLVPVIFVTPACAHCNCSWRKGRLDVRRRRCASDLERESVLCRPRLHLPEQGRRDCVRPPRPRKQQHSRIGWDAAKPGAHRLCYPGGACNGENQGQAVTARVDDGAVHPPEHLPYQGLRFLVPALYLQPEQRFPPVEAAPTQGVGVSAPTGQSRFAPAPQTETEGRPRKRCGQSRPCLLWRSLCPCSFSLRRVTPGGEPQGA